MIGFEKGIINVKFQLADLYHINQNYKQDNVMNI